MKGRNTATTSHHGTGRPRAPLAIVVLAAMQLVFVGRVMAGEDALTLRINDAVARPGGTLSVVMRTYEPRPVGQGQVCFRLFGTFAGGEGPLAFLQGSTVFSDTEPPFVSSLFDVEQQSSFLSFHSGSAGVNASDGPMIAVQLKIRPDAVPGRTYTLALEGADTGLVDSFGRLVPLELRSGELTLVDVDAPLTLATDGGEAPQGGTALIGLETQESFRLGAGMFVLTYDAALVDGVPSVTMDPRHGAATFTADTSVPGEVRVVFNSAGGNLNRVPGQLLTVRLPVAADAPLGSSPIGIDPATFALDSDGVPIALALEASAVQIVAGDGSFADDFETGDLSRWTIVVPAP